LPRLELMTQCLHGSLRANVQQCCTFAAHLRRQARRADPRRELAGTGRAAGRRPGPAVHPAARRPARRGKLTQWTKIRAGGPRSLAQMDDWLADKPVIPAARAAAGDLGRISAAATRRGRPRPVNDSWVAACCLAYGLPLATLNIKDYADFAEHDGLALIGQ